MRRGTDSAPGLTLALHEAAAAAAAAATAAAPRIGVKLWVELGRRLRAETFQQIKLERNWR